MKKFRNKFLEIPKNIHYLNSVEYSLADSHFLDTKFIEVANTKNPLMKSIPLNGEMTRLNSTVKNIAAFYPMLKPGVFVWDYSTGRYMGINADKAFPTASIIKIPVLFQLMKRYEKGVIDINNSLSTASEYISEGSGVLQYSPIGTTKTYRQLAKMMIQESDNTATNMILSSIGGKNELNTALKQWGFKTTHISEWLPDLGGTNVSTPKEMAQMLYNIDNPNFFSIESRAEIVEIMGHVKNRNLIQAGLPNNVQFIHKTGDIGSMLGDAGTVFLPDGRKYIIVIMVTRPWNNYIAKQFIIEVSNAVYCAFASGRV
jgi:beta-lactamase class A